MSMTLAASLAPDWDVEQFEPTPVSEREVSRVLELVYRKSGVPSQEGNRSLVVSRVQARLKAVGAGSCADYLTYLQRDASGGELVMLLDAVAASRTGFFREPQHFEFLRRRVVPEILAQRRPCIDVWSAACSSGEEPHTLAVVLNEALPDDDRRRLRILASDPSVGMLATARAGVYAMARLRNIEPALLRKFFDRGMGPHEGLARVKAALRQQVRFEQLDLPQIDDLSTRFAVIFCRNVLIHLDRAVQPRVVAMLERHLAPGGYLFISHAESLNGVSHGLRWVAPSVYRRGDA